MMSFAMSISSCRYRQRMWRPSCLHLCSLRTLLSTVLSRLLLSLFAIAARNHFNSRNLLHSSMARSARDRHIGVNCSSCRTTTAQLHCCYKKNGIPYDCKTNEPVPEPVIWNEPGTTSYVLYWARTVGPEAKVTLGQSVLVDLSHSAYPPAHTVDAAINSIRCWD